MQLEKKLHEDVYLYSGVLDDPEKLVRLIEELDEDESVQGVIPEWGFWFSNSQDGHSFGSKKDFNIDDIESLESDRKDDVLWVVGQIRGAIKKISEAYYKEHGDQGEPNISPFAGVMKYRPGCDMGPHFDAQAGDESLKYSIVVYLNDNYEGGEISFIVRPYDLRNPKNSHLQPNPDANAPENKELVDFTLKPKAGQALIFPSVHPFKHQVHTMKQGDKYMFPGFIFVDEFDPQDPEAREKFNSGSNYRDVNASPVKYLDEE
tara:strand:+ start:5175 stop:5960 length:786 start_codon:yes stop_codon:yes gene_type:complete